MHQIIKDAYRYNAGPNRPTKARFGYRLGYSYTHCGHCGKALREDQRPVPESFCSIECAKLAAGPGVIEDPTDA